MRSKKDTYIPLQCERRADFAKRISVSLRTVDYWIQQKYFPVIQPQPKCVLIPSREADEWLLRFKSGGAK